MSFSKRVGKMKYFDYLNEANQIAGLIPKDEYQKLKVAILCSFTIESIEPILRVEAFKEKMNIETYICGYSQYAQDILDETSGLYMFNPDVVILAIRLEEIAPFILNDYIGMMSKTDEVRSQIEIEMESLIRSVKTRCECSILLHNFMIPTYTCCSLFDFQHINGEVNFIRKLNLMLVKLVSKHPEVYVVDIENLAGMMGKQNVVDKKMWYIARNPFNTSFYQLLAREYIRYFKGIFGLKKKCIVLDLDNTLWGGTAGENGMNGIQLSDSFPGRCFKDFQMELIKLNKRGILLAINSKNNYEDAMEIIRNHPDMLLGEANFSCIRINWNNKASNMVEIADELNIGLESLVFIDDNEAECELIRQKLPEVATIVLPNNPLELVGVLAPLSFFDMVRITVEDIQKTAMYKAQLQRNQSKKYLGDLNAYYKSLEMVVTIREVNELLIPRVSELTQKTNQFNLTTRRYTPKDIQTMMQCQDFLLYAMKVVDRFGDNGNVGVCIIQKRSEKEWFIDTFLLSCRVMNRMLENALMAFAYDLAKANHVDKLIGEYFPTKKNKPGERFYEKLGFNKEADKFVLDIHKTCLIWPEYIVRGTIE